MTRRPWLAALGYTGLAVAGTWPLAKGLGSDVAWDLGDPVLIIWALAWNHRALLAILSGDVARLGTYFDANIFHPEPLTLAYSDHFFAQALQSLPVAAATGNTVLAYNLLFLSTFVLSGLGTYLWVRELTGREWPAFAAGVLFAFAPYRVAQGSHLQVLSTQWMPLALYALRRYLDGRRTRALAGAVAALVLLTWSSVYYLLYFSPFAAAYVLWEIAARGCWRDRRLWAGLAIAAAVVGLAAAPFLAPYAAVRERLRISRPLDEVIRYSADVYSYATAFSEQPLWGRVVRAYPKPEGELFPGVVPMALALVGIVAALRGTRTPPDARTRARRWLIRVLAVVFVALCAAALAALARRRVFVDAGPFVLRVSNVDRVALAAALSGGLLLRLLSGVRARVAALGAPGFLLAAIAAAWWLSLGPAPQSLGRPLDFTGAYAWLYAFVPGFDALRVPARFGMIGALMLAALGGIGVAALARRPAGRAVSVALLGLLLVESLPRPFVVNGVTPPPGYRAPEPRLRPVANPPAVYRAATRLPGDAVLADLPLGYPDFDIRAMYYATVHWRPVLNGYSGIFPPHYTPLTIALSKIPEHADAAWQALRGAGATHVLVHEAAYLGDEGPATTRALLDRGANVVFRDDGDVLLALP